MFAAFQTRHILRHGPPARQAAALGMAYLQMRAANERHAVLCLIPRKEPDWREFGG